MLRAFRAPARPLFRFALIRPFRFPDTKPLSCATLACHPPTPAKTGRFCTGPALRNESNSRRPAKSGIEPGAELSDEAAAWCDKHSAAQNPPRASREISRCASGRPRSSTQTLFGCNNSCSPAGIRSEGLSYGRDFDARQELTHSLDRGHQVLVGIRNTEPKIALSIRSKRCSA